MDSNEKSKRVAKMCREILDSEEPFYWHYNLSDKEKDLTIDALLRAVLGFAEMDKRPIGSFDYIEEKFFSAYNKVTGKEVYPI